jgi:hypothetical protein
MELKDIINKDFKHSFSSINKFKHNPSEWLVHYGLGLRVSSSPAMVRGNLAEFGAYYKIKKGMQQKDDKYFEKLIIHKFKKNKFFSDDSEIFNAINIAKKFEEKLYERQLRNIVSYQKEKVEKIKGLKYPVRLYSKVHNKSIALLYATPKKTLWYDLTEEDVQKGYDELLSDFKSLENYIDMCKNNLENAIKITPLNTDPSPFYWDKNIQQAATKIWRNVNK